MRAWLTSTSSASAVRGRGDGRHGSSVRAARPQAAAPRPAPPSPSRRTWHDPADSAAVQRRLHSGWWPAAGLGRVVHEPQGRVPHSWVVPAAVGRPEDARDVRTRLPAQPPTSFPLQQHAPVVDGGAGDVGRSGGPGKVAGVGHSKVSGPQRVHACMQAVAAAVVRWRVSSAASAQHAPDRAPAAPFSPVMLDWMLLAARRPASWAV